MYVYEQALSLFRFQSNKSIIIISNMCYTYKNISNCTSLRNSCCNSQTVIIHEVLVSKARAASVNCYLSGLLYGLTNVYFLINRVNKHVRRFACVIIALLN